MQSLPRPVLSLVQSGLLRGRHVGSTNPQVSIAVRDVCCQFLRRATAVQLVVLVVLVDFDWRTQWAPCA